MFILNNTDVVILIFRFSVASTTGLMAVTKLTPAAEDDTIQELLASFRANPEGLHPSAEEPAARSSAGNSVLAAPAKGLHAQLQSNLSQSDRDVVDLLAQCAESQFTQFTQFTQLSQATPASQHAMGAPFSAPREAPPGNKASSLNFSFLQRPSTAQPPTANRPQDKAAPPSTGVRTPTFSDNAAGRPLVSSNDASPHEKGHPSPEAWSGLSGQLLPALSQIEGDDHAWQDVEADPAWEQQARLLSPSSLASQKLSGKRKAGGQQASRDPVVDEKQHRQETQIPLVARRKIGQPVSASTSARATATSRDVAPRPKRENRSPSTMGIALGSDAQYKQLKGLSDSQLEERMCLLAASPFAPDVGRRLLRFTQLYTERFDSDTF